MTTDTERELFARLAEDASRASLDGAAEVRRRGDRRTALGALGGTLAVVAVVAAVVLGASSLFGRSAGPDVVDSPTPTSSPSEPLPTRIPGTAWLGAADLNDPADLSPTDESFPGCRFAVNTDGEVAPVLRGLRFGFYRAPELSLDYVPDGTIYQQIRVYDPSDEPLLEFVGLSCRSHVLQDLDAAQPDLVQLLSVRDGSAATWIAVVRVDDVFSVLALQGWEGTSATEEDARRLAAVAATRLHAWLD